MTEVQPLSGNAVRPGLGRQHVGQFLAGRASRRGCATACATAWFPMSASRKTRPSRSWALPGSVDLLSSNCFAVSSGPGRAWHREEGTSASRSPLSIGISTASLERRRPFRLVLPGTSGPGALAVTGPRTARLLNGTPLPSRPPHPGRAVRHAPPLQPTPLQPTRLQPTRLQASSWGAPSRAALARSMLHIMPLATTFPRRQGPT